MMARSAPVRQLVFAAGIVFSCLAVATMLLGRRWRIVTLALLVLVLCAIFALVTR
jgi:hypothetical protein